MTYNHRYIARIILEAKTSLFVGSGESSLLKDAIVQKDHLGLPMIQGTSLAGVLSHSFFDQYDLDKFDKEKEELIKLWGYQLHGKEKEAYQAYFKENYPDIKEDKIPAGYGSRFKISSAYMLYEKDKVAEGLDKSDIESVLSKFESLPARQHVRITDKGVSDPRGLYNHEVVYAGTRFIFEVELIGNECDKDTWTEMLNRLYQPSFRLGQGSRKGFGSLQIERVDHRIYNLTIEKDFEDYLNFDPSFNKQNDGLIEFKATQSDNLSGYTLELKPDSFFIFSEGAGDAEVNNRPVMEETVEYHENGGISFNNKTLIPASSIKGAISHRVAFHYNKLHKRWAGTAEAKTSDDNEAVIALFGTKKDDKEGQRGFVIINDIYFDEEVINDKIFNHVAIDRFTGGALEGALFSEKVSAFTYKEARLKIEIYLEKTDFEDSHIIKALELTLEDICKGLLPLGSMITKGHGIFTGLLKKDKTEIFNYEA
ncbi:RAMP superfamily CRISPR-associated protein [Emticicia fluvialis]|uniref:RAMP superfamily CRISPR-associated protein n=1 Tax=Emticicia fluvialis TaxID=2974474 RepID=UPI002164FB2C|nr:RAMP superfamily CRISPR-associated protein [Emticicia fluvialis]